MSQSRHLATDHIRSPLIALVAVMFVMAGVDLRAQTFDPTLPKVHIGCALAGKLQSYYGANSAKITDYVCAHIRARLEDRATTRAWRFDVARPYDIEFRIEQASHLGSRWLVILFGTEYDAIEIKIADSEKIGRSIPESKTLNWGYVRDVLADRAVENAIHSRLIRRPVTCGGSVIKRDSVPWVESSQLESGRYEVFRISRFLVEPVSVDAERCADQRTSAALDLWMTTTAHEIRSIGAGSKAIDVLALRLPDRLVDTVTDEQEVGRTFIYRYCPPQVGQEHCSSAEADVEEVMAGFRGDGGPRAFQRMMIWLTAEVDSGAVGAVVDLAVAHLQLRERPETATAALEVVPPLVTFGHDESGERILRETLRWAATERLIANAYELEAALITYFSWSQMSVQKFVLLWKEDVRAAIAMTDDDTARKRLEWVNNLYSPEATSLGQVPTADPIRGDALRAASASARAFQRSDQLELAYSRYFDVWTAEPTFEAALDVLGVVEIDPQKLDPQGSLADRFVLELSVPSQSGEQYLKGMRAINGLRAYVYDGLGRGDDAARAMESALQYDARLFQLDPSIEWWQLTGRERQDASELKLWREWERANIRSIGAQQIRQYMPWYAKRLDEEQLWSALDNPLLPGRQLGFIGFPEIGLSEANVVYFNNSLGSWLTGTLMRPGEQGELQFDLEDLESALTYYRDIGGQGSPYAIWNDVEDVWNPVAGLMGAKVGTFGHLAGGLRDGEFINWSIDPDYREALTVFREWYDKGFIVADDLARSWEDALIAIKGGHFAGFAGSRQWTIDGGLEDPGIRARAAWEWDGDWNGVRSWGVFSGTDDERLRDYMTFLDKALYGGNGSESWLRDSFLTLPAEDYGSAGFWLTYNGRPRWEDAGLDPGSAHGAAGLESQYFMKAITGVVDVDQTWNEYVGAWHNSVGDLTKNANMLDWAGLYTGSVLFGP